ncbi:hypothetical protein [Pseudactinotalea terrae]|uniref:hypothetical protein n=1 Tax=Pseudactinotalea terrae TaxID=1743262 RepID=UPI0012E31ED2|nr:hypothetical protein [Pseudactinotalea terrae]
MSTTDTPATPEPADADRARAIALHPASGRAQAMLAHPSSPRTRTMLGHPSNGPAHTTV